MPSIADQISYLLHHGTAWYAATSGLEIVNGKDISLDCHITVNYHVKIGGKFIVPSDRTCIVCEEKKCPGKMWSWSIALDSTYRHSLVFFHVLGLFHLTDTHK